MKLIIRSYLESLKEREELDAILPDLLSELGFVVYSRPGRGTTQHGVDVAAIGKDENGEQKVYLFSVKRGDLTRQDWDNSSPQGLRTSLNQIMDAYIPTRIPKQYKNLKIVICLCFGGDIREQVRTEVTGFINKNSTDRISFEEWNGDKIAGLLLHGILREEILPKALRSSFQKAVAMIDEPDIAYRHFADLSRNLLKIGEANLNTRVRAARQIYICLWILFVWARDVDNVDAPYRASELAILNVWHLLRPFIGKKTKHAKSITAVITQLIQLNLIIAEEFLERKIFPLVGKRHAISVAVETRSSVDVNLKLFDLIGRISMTGIWFYWLAKLGNANVEPKLADKISEFTMNGFKLINNNPVLFSPICDQQAIEIALFLILSRTSSNDGAIWLREMVDRLDLNVRTHGKYPCVYTNYRDLSAHPRSRSDEYMKEATSGSILIPTLAAWLAASNDMEALKKLSKLHQSKLPHCTLQLWLPDSNTENELYTGGHGHGVALLDLVLTDTGKELLETVEQACEKEKGFYDLSAIRTGYWPIVLVSCRHFRHPVPPQFWLGAIRPNED